jgi:hypothetical protein
MRTPGDISRTSQASVMENVNIHFLPELMQL